MTLRIVLPPSEEELYNQIIEISDSSETVIFGDFNIPVTAWGNPASSHSGRDIYDSLLESALSQHANKPTRGYNIFGLLFSTNDSLISNVIVCPEFSASDTRIVTFDIYLKVYKENSSE